MSAVLSGLEEGFSSDKQIAQLRIPPHSIEAESSVLGGLLLDNGAWDRVGDLLAESDFYRYEHRQVYAAISALVNTSRPADVITVYEHLQALGKAVVWVTLMLWLSMCQVQAIFVVMPKSCVSDRFCESW